MATIVIVFIAVFVTVVGMLIGFEIYRRFEDHEKRITKLEKAGGKRVPFQSQDEILNAVAALDSLLHEFNFGTNFIENAKAHLAKSMAVGTRREEKAQDE